MPPTSSRPAPRGVPQIETVRVLCLVSIVVYHYWSALKPELAADLFGVWGSKTLGQGGLAVIIFNAIAGFVLTLAHVGPKAKPPMGFADFYKKRFAKILPPYIIALFALTFLAAARGLGPQGWIDFLEHLFLVHTLDPARFFSISPALWWLGMFAQFYIVFPLLIRLMLKVGTLRFLFLSLVFPILWGVVHFIAVAKPGSVFALIDYMAYFNLPGRLPEFALGMLFAHGHSLREASGVGHWPFIPLGFAGLLVSVLALGFGPAMPNWLAHQFWVCGFTGAALMLFQVPLAATIGRSAVVAKLGVLSYGVYLLHQPIMEILAQWFAGFGLVATLLSILVGFTLAIIAALGLQKLVAVVD